MTTLQEDFEKWCPFDTDKKTTRDGVFRYYDAQVTQDMWVACQAATERAAKMCDAAVEQLTDTYAVVTVLTEKLVVKGAAAQAIKLSKSIRGDV